MSSADDEFYASNRTEGAVHVKFIMVEAGYTVQARVRRYVSSGPSKESPNRMWLGEAP